MTKTFEQLQEVIEDAEFPALDLALRRGFHVDRDSASWYALLSEAQEMLEGFYRRYGCELIHKTDGYFYLLPTSDQLPRRQLSAQDMLVGQALALLYLDPISLERGGIVTREQVIEQLVVALGTAPLMAAFVPKKRRKDEQAAQRQTRARVAEVVRRLASLGFAELLPNEQLRLRPALLRFAEPVRGLAEPAAALAQLVARGEVALVEDEGTAGAQPDADSDLDDGETDADARQLEGDPDADDGETDGDSPQLNARSDVHGNDVDDSQLDVSADDRATYADGTELEPYSDDRANDVDGLQRDAGPDDGESDQNGPQLDAHLDDRENDANNLWLDVDSIDREADDPQLDGRANDAKELRLDFGSGDRENEVDGPQLDVDSDAEASDVHALSPDDSRQHDEGQP